MRILLVADIHANWPALRAIDETFDVCLVLGDLVDYGLDPTPCIDWVRQQATHAIRGNHDHGVAQRVTVVGKNGFRYLTGVTRPISQEKISQQDRRFLAALPVTKMVTLEDVRYLLVHATPRDPLDEYALADKDFWARRLENVDAQVICVGHTHFPYVLEVDDKLVINPGSVGQPRDGDPRASYAIIEDHRVDLKRIEYPVEETVRLVLTSSLPEMAKSLLSEVFRNGTLPPLDVGKPKPPDSAKGRDLGSTQAFESTYTVADNGKSFDSTQVLGQEEEFPFPESTPEPAKKPQLTSLGDYKLLEKLGEGGMGTVYKAEQTSKRRLVAIKVLFGHLAKEQVFRQRFLREANILSRLKHPNILEFIEAKEANGTFFIAMEFAGGGSVQAHVDRLGKFPMGDALHIAVAAANALQHAHQQGMIHRDINPENLLLTDDGTVKLADLGLAKSQEDTMSLTQTGTGAGTPTYMAPEQARDVKRVDKRSDIYSLGCMLYRFLTGELPFTGRNIIELVQAKDKGIYKPARNLNSEIPEELDDILRRMLASKPDDRIASCEDLLIELQGLGLDNPSLSFFEQVDG